MKVKIVVAIIALLIISGVSAIGAAYYFVKIQKVSLKETAYIYISPDDDANSIMDKIQETAQPQSMIGFRLLAHHNKFGNQRRSGRYAIYDNDNMHSIYRRIVCKEQTPVKVVVPATRTIPQLLSAIEKQLMLDSTALSPFTTEPVYYTKIGYTKESLPSLFLPNTYEMYWTTSPKDVVQRFKREYDAFWNEERQAKAKKLGLSQTQVITLASIIVQETNHVPEQPAMAAVYLNRLKKGMKLQACPTVIYALKDVEPGIRRVLNRHLKYDSPYNTYKYAGLPPGPITIPTLAAIDAVLNRDSSQYLYFCANSNFDGTHKFTASYQEHLKNGRAYQKALKARESK